MKSIAIYGKGGIGKSTIASNMAIALGNKGFKVLLIGCDPKADSTINITRRRIMPLLELMKRNRKPLLEEFLFKKDGVYCIEMGGPEPGIGCAGRGIIVGVSYLVENLDLRDFDFVIFDVPADVVCGGLAIVVKEGYAEGVLIITSHEFTSLYAANNICKSLSLLKAKSCGILYNKATSRGSKRVEKFSERTGVPIIGRIPYSEDVNEADRLRKTVVELFPKSEIAQTITTISLYLLKEGFGVTPNYLKVEELEEIFSEDS